MNLKKLLSETTLGKKFGLGLFEIINKDFRWNLILSVQDIEENEIDDEFILFVEFVVFAVVKRVKRVTDELNISSDDKTKLKWDISYIVIDFISQKYNTYLLTYRSMKEIENKIRTFLKSIEQPEDILSLDYEDLYNLLQNNFNSNEREDDIE